MNEPWPAIFTDLFNRPAMRPGEARLPWADHAFSVRMLREHLDERHDLASRRASTIDAHVRWLESMLPESGGRVLDLGCGPGLYLERLAAAGSSGVGVDVAPASIDHARARAAALDLPCEYILGDFRSADVDGEFDLMLCLFGELSTVPINDVQHVFDRIGRQLRPSGRAVIELSTRTGVRKKGTRPMSWYATSGGLFADGLHLVLMESAWFDDDNAAVERWWTIEAAEPRPHMLGSTTWWHVPGLESALSRAGLAIDQRFGDLCGRSPQDGDEFETLVLHSQRPGV